MKSSEVYCLGYRCRNSMDRSTYWRLCPRRAPQQLNQPFVGFQGDYQAICTGKVRGTKGEEPNISSNVPYNIVFMDKFPCQVEKDAIDFFHPAKQETQPC